MYNLLLLSVVRPCTVGVSLFESTIYLEIFEGLKFANLLKMRGSHNYKIIWLLCIIFHETRNLWNWIPQKLLDVWYVITYIPCRYSSIQAEGKHKLTFIWMDSSSPIHWWLGLSMVIWHVQYIVTAAIHNYDTLVVCALWLIHLSITLL